MQISQEEFNTLFKEFEHELLHMETRDAYGTAFELPHMAKWAAGEPDDIKWLQGWCDTVREGASEGKSFRRALVVSEPLGDYQQWAYGMTQPLVDAGEDIRWVPRRLISSIAIPGNDFYLVDDRLAVFMHYSGNGMTTNILTSTDPTDIRLCRSSFEAVWNLSIPHNEYKPLWAETSRHENPFLLA